MQCNRIGDGQRWADERACVRSVSIRAEAELGGWECSPASTRARYKDCAASVTEEPCATIVDRESNGAICAGATGCND
jgi:hypothetical protein